MAILVWTSYSFNGDKSPVSEAKHRVLVQQTERDFPRLLADMRSERWSAFRARHVGRLVWWWGPIAAGVGLITVGRMDLGAAAGWLEWLGVAGALLCFWPFYRGLSVSFSAMSHGNSLSAECHYLTRAHEIARAGGSYEDYRRKHAEELSGTKVLSHDSRLALLLAALGLLIVSIPICAPLAIILGVIGLRKGRRYSMAAIVLGVLELVGFAVMLTMMNE